MKTIKESRSARFAGVLVCVVVCVMASGTAFAHCDTMDGPVVSDAMAALESKDVTPVLKWVNPEDEEEIKTVFKKVLSVRSNGPVTQDIADRYFFETLVRLHRAAEGAPYTGLKPAGTIEAPVAAADKAMESGSVDELARKIGSAAEDGVRSRFMRVMEARKSKDDSIEAGRRYVEAYVDYVHFVEGLHTRITGGGAHHEH